MENVMTLKEAQEELEKLSLVLSKTISKLGYDCDNVESPRNSNSDMRFIRDEMRRIANQLESVHDEIQYLQQPIVAGGYLAKNERGRYELSGERDELTSGRTIEVLAVDSDGEPLWVKTKIEHDGSDYCCKILGRLTPLDGLEARYR